MLKVLAATFTFAFAALCTLAANDAALSATLITEVTEGHRKISAELLTAALSFRSEDDFEPMLMGFLAGSTVALYFRRKYRIAERGWQRITAFQDSVAPEPLFRSSLQR